ncbi:isochorismatase family protein [Endozoicomonas sp. SCSIO W0465]|uniref:isochorismatase family protein n=1 Tax=Endozoicomonas sp. SCSIO W0465 TaxID=2918516 RepID=UPI002074B8F6|nr:isochorismatase family protein [Endozoicomonas sp. SCSIO W0465]USE39749.1 isochorismatase family protein [Endozoicomonas sp. SCSIO W0465]
MYSIGSRETVAAFDVDAQKCFTPLCPDELPVPDGHQIAGELNRQARLAGIRVGSKDAHPANAVWVAMKEYPQLTPITGYKNVDLRWNRHAVPGTEGFELVDGLPDVTDYDYFVWKGVEADIHPYGACFHDLEEKLSTGVIEFLKHKGVATVVVGGLALDFCVKTTALQLQRAGFQVYVNRAATRGLAESSVAGAIAELQAAGIILVESSSDLTIADTISHANAI